MGYRIAHGLASLGIVAATLGSSMVAQASESYPLTSEDFFNLKYAQIGTDSNQQPDIGIDFNSGSASVDVSRFPRYNAVTFALGADSSDAVDSASAIQVLGDGHVIKSIPLTAASTTPAITVRYSGHHILTFQRIGGADDRRFYVFEPTLIHVGLTPPPAPTIVLASGSVKGGGQQTIDVATRANLPVTILIVYANGRHMLIGPQRSGPTGHDIYTFTVPNGVTGSAQVVAVVNGTGVAQATFTVS